MGCRRLTYSNYFTPQLRVLKDDVNKHKTIPTNKYQWDLIHDPKKMVAKWTQDEDEGASILTIKEGDLNLYIQVSANEVFEEDGELERDKKTPRYYKNGEILILPEGKLKFKVEKKYYEIFKGGDEVNKKIAKAEDIKYKSKELTDANNNPLEVTLDLLDKTEWQYPKNKKEIGTKIKTETLKPGTYKLKADLFAYSDQEFEKINSIDLEKGTYRVQSKQTCEIDLKIVGSSLITFEPDGIYNGEYGFDPYLIPVLADNYETNNEIEDNYKVTWLSSYTKNTINLLAKYNIPEGKGEDYHISFTSIPEGAVLINDNEIFEIKKGNEILGKRLNAINLKLTIVDESADTPIKLMAYYHLGDNEKKPIGQINIISKENPIQAYKYTLVKVNTNSGNAFPDMKTVNTKLQTYLQENSFNQAFINWQISGDIKEYTLPYDDFKNYLSTTDKNVIDEGSTEQFFATVRNRYYTANPNDVTVGMYYIYIIDRDIQAGSNEAGAAVGNSSIIYFSTITDSKTYAHELGHNLGLLHSFKDEDGDGVEVVKGNKIDVNEGTTHNFMDYSKNTNMFWKCQWDNLKK